MAPQPRHPDTRATGFLQLIGHPLRWRLMTELARSDRLVSELTNRTGEPQNLVSYHLGKLRDAKIVSMRRSSADRRDAYYTANLRQIGDELSALGSALHPGLQHGVSPPTARTTSRTLARPTARLRVLFLCTGNSARSQMAQALTKARAHGRIEAFSAGSEPKPIHPLAIRAMQETFGIDLSKQQSRHLKVYSAQSFDWVITLCDKVREVCPEFPGHPQATHWSMPNPAAPDRTDGRDYEAFLNTARELDVRIDFLLAMLAHPGTDLKE